MVRATVKAREWVCRLQPLGHVVVVKNAGSQLFKGSVENVERVIVPLEIAIRHKRGQLTESLRASRWEPARLGIEIGIRIGSGVAGLFVALEICTLLAQLEERFVHRHLGQVLDPG